MDDAQKCPDHKELLRLSLECYKSFQRQYPLRIMVSSRLYINIQRFMTLPLNLRI